MMNNDQEIHTMVCERVLENGIDVFICPACGRKILIQWMPVLRQVVLEPGDEGVLHSAAPIDEHDESPEMAMVDQPLENPVDELRRLADWEQWLRAIDFETWWV
jgi:hypothetical protein